MTGIGKITMNFMENAFGIKKILNKNEPHTKSWRI